MGTDEPDRESATPTVSAHSADTRKREVNQSAFVLHAYPWKETSLIAELFTRNFGRLPVMAKGARRAQSQLRGLIMPFQPLLVTWSGKGELRVLHSAEWQGGVAQLSGSGLMCGFYLNELLMRALAREDAHVELFDAYYHAIESLAAQQPQAPVLRAFELQLLTSLGYAVDTARDAVSGEALRARSLYRYVPERGPELTNASLAGNDVVVRGKTLADMSAGQYDDPVTAQESKLLLRYLIDYHLGNPELHTRQFAKELQQI